MIVLHDCRWPKKDTKKRKTYKKFEIRKLVLKSLISSTNYTFNYKMHFSRLFYSYTLNSSISRYRNYCMLIVFSRSIFKFLKLSRHMVKHCMSQGLLVGFRKSSF